ncbi:ABC transporter ATP-binding protein [Paraburkholderia sp. CI3]|uniref:ABC transporter ATP-binding protein n=1 Tax=Paraburkholderia sp. CI3 TaxID=2991060 RepID=UPI003D24F2A9
MDEAAREADKLAVEGPGVGELDALVRGDVMVAVDDLVAGYSKMEILHGVSLRVGAGQSLCLIGPNGAGKSTVLHAIYGFARILSGKIVVNDRDVTRLPPNEKLRAVGIAYILQDNSVFPDMTVEENLLMGGFLLVHPRQAKEAAEKVFDKYKRLAERRTQRASVLSGGERRLLEIARSLIMDPAVLLVDEPSIGLEPRFIDMVFEILQELQQNEGKTIVLVEQNARKGLEFSNIGYVLTAGRVAMAGIGAELARNPDVGRLFLGGQ